jgi:hypothetical protein
MPTLDDGEQKCNERGIGRVRTFCPPTVVKVPPSDGEVLYPPDSEFVFGVNGKSTEYMTSKLEAGEWAMRFSAPASAHSPSFCHSPLLRNLRWEAHLFPANTHARAQVLDSAREARFAPTLVPALEDVRPVAQGGESPRQAPFQGPVGQEVARRGPLLAARGKRGGCVNIRVCVCVLMHAHTCRRTTTCSRRKARALHNKHSACSHEAHSSTLIQRLR